MKKYLPYIILAILTAVFFLSKSFMSVKNGAEIQAPETAIATLAIDYGNGNKNEYEAPINQDDTAYSILKDNTEKQGIYIEVQQYDFGVFVKRIGDLESDSLKAWIYYVNDVSGSVAADGYKLQNGDVVLWKYEDVLAE